mmetsp:Transcript_7964/g.11461  ORF Transcript_7964/g.11461 Transcript_7964/m.11461 type:complete len:94 (-) Transcript_7964:66-347(-)|eukprot:scaffold293764_cov30-Tisochrysis_lutea.AAC.1
MQARLAARLRNVHHRCAPEKYRHEGLNPVPIVGTKPRHPRPMFSTCISDMPCHAVLTIDVPCSGRMQNPYNKLVRLAFDHLPHEDLMATTTIV